MKYIKGLVSVVIPTYRRSTMLIRAIESVLNQTYKNIELLLVNDNEPDDEFTQELYQKIKIYEKDNRFHLLLQERHINGAAARNFGIKKARGEFIAFLDDDDWWEKDKIEKQLECIQNLDDSWGGVSCKFKLINKDGKIVAKSLKYEDGYIYKDILKLITEVTTCSLLLKHDYLDEVGYFDENLKRSQDLQLLINFTYKYKLKELDSYLLNIDISDDQNRLNGDKILEVKKEFFKSINFIMETLSSEEKKCIYSMHYFEIGYVYLKHGNIIKGLKYILYIFRSLESFKTAIRKIKIRTKQNKDI